MEPNSLKTYWVLDEQSNIIFKTGLKNSMNISNYNN